MLSAMWPACHFREETDDTSEGYTSEHSIEGYTSEHSIMSAFCTPCIVHNPFLPLTVLHDYGKRGDACPCTARSWSWCAKGSRRELGPGRGATGDAVLHVLRRRWPGAVSRAGVRRQSACAKLTLKTTRNVRVRAPKTSECVRQSVRNVRVRAPIHADCARVARRRRRLVEGHVRVKKDGARRREGVSCGLAQIL